MNILNLVVIVILVICFYLAYRHVSKENFQEITTNSLNLTAEVGTGSVGTGSVTGPKAMEKILEIENQIQVKKGEIRTAFESENQGQYYYDSSLYKYIENELMSLPIAQLDSLADNYFKSQIEDRSIDLGDKLQSVLDALNKISNLRIELDEAKKALETPVKASIDGRNPMFNMLTEVEEEDNKPSEPVTGGNITTGSLTGGNTTIASLTGGNTTIASLTGGNTTTGTLTGGNTTIASLTGGNTTTGSEMPEAEFEVPNDPDITTNLDGTYPDFSGPTIDVNRFMFDKTIKTYKEKKLNIHKFVNDLINLLGSIQNISPTNYDGFERNFISLQNIYSDDYNTYSNILRNNFDKYKVYIGKDNLKLGQQLKVLLGRSEGIIFDNDPVTIDPFPMSNWPCMYYNESSCPETRCLVEKDTLNPNNNDKPYTNVICIPNEDVKVDQCTGYYGEKNCKMHKVVEKLPGFTNEYECTPIGGGVKCHGNIPPNYNCSHPDHLLNVYGSGVLHDTVIATKCMTKEGLNTLPPKYINKKNLSSVDEEELKALCISNPNSRWNDDLKQCYDNSDCYSRNSDTCEIDTGKCFWKNLFFSPDSKNEKYVPQGFCLSK